MGESSPYLIFPDWLRLNSIAGAAVLEMSQTNVIKVNTAQGSTAWCIFRDLHIQCTDTFYKLRDI